MFIKWLNNIINFKSLIKKYKKELFIFLFLDILCITLLVISPAFTSQIIIQLIKKNYYNIILFLIILIINKLLFLLFSFFSTKVFLSFRKKVMVEFKKEVSKDIVNQDIVIFLKNRKGKYINRLLQDIDEIPIHLTYIRDYAKVLFTNIFTVFYLIYLDYRIGLVYLISLFLMIYFKIKGINHKSKYTKLFLLEKEKTSNEISELYNGILDVKQLDLSDNFNKKIEKHFLKSEKYQYKGDILNNIFYIISKSIEWISTLIVILMGTFLIKNNKLLLDTFITIFMYRSIVFSVDGCLQDLLLRMSLMNISCERLFEIWTKNSNQESITTINNDLKGDIEFSNVSFKYTNKLVLNKCSFKLKKNNLYLLVGNSGSGKTTIFSLLTRLYDNYEGEIYLDNKELREYDKKYLLNNISIISQNYYLFDMSIKDNFLIANSNLSMDKIIEVCKQVGIHDDIMKLDNKYDTIIGEGAKFLSGGQKQRIAIARSILLNRKIILFDEATSALDSKLENKIFELVKSLQKNHTIIFITHNKQLITNNSNVLVLKNGKIKE